MKVIDHEGQAPGSEFHRIIVNSVPLYPITYDNPTVPSQVDI